MISRFALDFFRFLGEPMILCITKATDWPRPISADIQMQSASSVSKWVTKCGSLSRQRSVTRTTGPEVQRGVCEPIWKGSKTILSSDWSPHSHAAGLLLFYHEKLTGAVSLLWTFSRTLSGTVCRVAKTLSSDCLIALDSLHAVWQREICLIYR